jgi:hypothetical protein
MTNLQKIFATRNSSELRAQLLAEALGIALCTALSMVQGIAHVIKDYLCIKLLITPQEIHLIDPPQAGQ